MTNAGRLGRSVALLLAAATVSGTGLLMVAPQTHPAYADVYSDYNRSVANRDALKRQLSGVDSDLANQILQLDDLNSNKIPAAQQAADSARQSADQAKSLAQATADRLQAAQQDKQNLETQIKQTGADYDDAKAGVAQQARDGFHGSDASQVMDVVTKSSTTRDFVDKMQSSAAVARSESNAASADAAWLGRSSNRKDRLAAIETQIGKLKEEADSQAASAQKASDDAQAQQANLQALRDQGAQARQSLEAKKGELTSASAREAAQVALLSSKIDALNQSSAVVNAHPNASSGGQQGAYRPPSANNGGGAPAAPSNPGYNGHPTGDAGYNGYPSGQCTWWAYERRHQLGLPVGSFFGNGAQWAGAARAFGYSVDNTPRSVGDIVVFQPGQAGADRTYGHVAIVEGIFGNSIMVSECNYGSVYVTRRMVGNAGAYQYIHS